MFLESNEGSVKLADYGSTLLVNMLLDVIWPERTKDWLYWQAPETLEEIDSADNRSDVWSLGCLTFELLTGHPPFYQETKGSLESLHQMHVNKKPPQMPERASIDCQEFLKACLKYDPNERSTIMELRQLTFLSSTLSETYEEPVNPPPARTHSGLTMGNFIPQMSAKHVARSLTGNKGVWEQFSMMEIDHPNRDEDSTHKIPNNGTIEKSGQRNFLSQPLLKQQTSESMNLHDQVKATELDKAMMSPDRKATESPSKVKTVFSLNPVTNRDPPCAEPECLDEKQIQDEMDRLLEYMIKEGARTEVENPQPDMSVEFILEEQERLLREMMEAPEPIHPILAIPPEIEMRPEIPGFKDSDSSSDNSSPSNVPKIDASGIRARINSSGSRKDQLTPFAVIRRTNMAPRKLTHQDKLGKTPLDSKGAHASVYKPQDKRFIFTNTLKERTPRNTDLKPAQPQNTDRRSSAFQPGSLNMFSPIVVRRGSQGGQDIPNSDALSLQGPESPGKTHTTFGASTNARKVSAEQPQLNLEASPMVEHEIGDQKSARSSKRTIPNNSFGIMMQTAVMNSGLKGKLQKITNVQRPDFLGNFLVSDGSKTARGLPNTSPQKQLIRTNSQIEGGVDILKRASELQGANHLLKGAITGDFNTGSSKMREKLKKFNFGHTQDQSNSSSHLESARKDPKTGGSQFKSVLLSNAPVFFEAPQVSKDSQPEISSARRQQPVMFGRHGALTPRTKGGDATPKLVRKKLSTPRPQTSRNTLPQIKTEQSPRNMQPSSTQQLPTEETPQV